MGKKQVIVLSIIIIVLDIRCLNTHHDIKFLADLSPINNYIIKIQRF